MSGPVSIAEPPVTAITDVALIDVTSAATQVSRTVVLAGGVIERIGPTEMVDVPPETLVIPGSNHWLIPGLWDMHVHTAHPDQDIRSYLAHGVTGVRDMGGANPDNPPAGSFSVPWPRLRVVRDAIRAGTSRGPQMVAAGVMLDGPEPWPGTLGVADPAAGREIVRWLREQDVDFVKVGTGITPDCYRAVVAEARRLGLSVAGHVPEAMTAIEVADLGQRSIEHVMGLPADCFTDPIPGPGCDAALHALAASGVWSVPTLVAWKAAALGDDRRLPDADPDSFARLLAVVGAMHGAGIPILTGSDCGVPDVVPGASLHQELGLLVEAGLSPREALAAATTGPARFLGISATHGTIEVGKRADLVLLAADPLDDISNTARISAVLVGGHLISEPDSGCSPSPRARADDRP